MAVFLPRCSNTLPAFLRNVCTVLALAEQIGAATSDVPSRQQHFQS